MSKTNYEEVLENELNYEEVLYCTNHFIEDIKNETKLFIHHTRKALKKAQKQEKLLELYKEFFDKLNIQLRNTFDIDYIYPHEFIIGYDIKSEDKELVKLFKQIKELENEKEI